MTKDQLIELVQKSAGDDNLKQMVLAYINTAYHLGFQDGMIRGVQVQNQIFDVLLKTSGEGWAAL